MKYRVRWSTSWNKIAGRNINNLRYADDTTLKAKSKELKSLLMKMKEESKKAGLKLNIRKTKIMASGPITSWQIDGETMQTMRDLIFFFKLYIIVLVLPNIKMNPPQVYMCSPSWSLLPCFDFIVILKDTSPQHWNSSLILRFFQPFKDVSCCLCPLFLLKRQWSV